MHRSELYSERCLLQKHLFLADGKSLNRLLEHKDLRARFRWVFGGCMRQTVHSSLADS
jgi:hypothetical protein